MNKVLEVSDLYFKYDTDYVLKGVNLSVEKGDFISIIGENGCGKSTLLNLIIQNLKLQKGEIKLFYDSISENNHFKDITYISQNSVMNFKTFPTTIKEVVKNHMKFLKINKNVDHYLEMIGLKEHKNKALNELSGGQLQRVGLLLALIKEAKLILLDEPTTGIDEKFSTEFFSLLRELANKGKTIIMITHELDMARDFVDYVFHIKNGIAHKLSICEFQNLVEI